MFQKYLSFIGLCLGFFIIMMDTTTVPLVYITLMKRFAVSPATVAWVNNIYLITYAAFLLLGGRLGDFTHRKNVVLVAYFVLGLGAAISGAGQNFTNIMIGRALMGVGAGLLTPQNMAYISIIFANKGRGTAIGIWGTVAGIATATGPAITQIFLMINHWRWVMWINIPIAFICFLIAAWTLPKDSGQGIKFWDTLISSLYGLCIALIIIGIQLSSVPGVTRLGEIFFIIGAAATAILIRDELRKKRGYILSPALWFDDSFLKICLISGLLGLGLTGFYLPLAFLLNLRMNLGPMSISAVMMTFAITNAIIGPFAGNISDRVQPQMIIRLGLILFAFANILVGFIGVFMPGGIMAFMALCAVMMVAGTGTGLTFAPLANFAVGRAHRENVGRAAAFFNCVRQASSALGGVLIAMVFDLIIRLQLEQKHAITAANLRQSPNATAIASLACFLLIALSLVVGAYLFNSPRQEPVLAELY